MGFFSREILGENRRNADRIASGCRLRDVDACKMKSVLMTFEFDSQYSTSFFSLITVAWMNVAQ
jgi:hypothetical protein